MSDFEKLASTRRSIRKFASSQIPDCDIEDIIRIATMAPSGCNSQCWRFVAIRDKTVLKQIEAAVLNRLDELLSSEREKLTEQYLSSKNKMVTFFAKAPVVIAVFMTKLDYYDPTLVSVLNKQGYVHDDIMRLLAYPDLLSIGAAVQNLLLAVHEKGYGACWMNEAGIAGKEIGNILGIPDDNKFISLVPLGVPAYTPKEKVLKPVSDVLTFV